MALYHSLWVPAPGRLQLLPVSASEERGAADTARTVVQSPIHAFLQLPCKNLRPSNVGPQSAEQSGTPRRAFLTTLARARNRPSGRPLPGHASQTLEGIGQNGQPAMRQLNNSEVTEPELAIEMIGLGAWNKCPPRTHNYTMRLFNPVSSTVLWAWRPRRGISVLPRNRTR